MLHRAKIREKKTLCMLLILALMVTLTGCASVPKAEVETVGMPTFDVALREDRLVLVPVPLSMSVTLEAWAAARQKLYDSLAEYDFVYDNRTRSTQVWPYTLEGEEFYDKVTIISLSPDGEKALIYVDKLLDVWGLAEDDYLRDMPLAVWDIKSNNLHFMAPTKGKDMKLLGEQLELFVMNIKPNRLSDVNVAWSPDGKYLSLSFARQVLISAFYGCNIWLIDIEAGAFQPLIAELPKSPRPTRDGLPFGTPIRSVFSDDSNALYYEVFMKDIVDVRVSEILRYDIATGLSKSVGMYNSEFVLSDTSLWYTPFGIAHSFTPRQLEDGYGGVMLWSHEGEKRIIEVEIQEDNTMAGLMRGARLIDVRGKNALARGFDYEYSQNDTPLAQITGHVMSCFVLDDSDGNAYGTLLLLRPQSNPASRVSWYDWRATQSVKEDLKSLAEDGAVSPHNGVFSPDGRYLMLAAGLNGENSLFVYDFQQDICGRVDVSVLVESSIELATFNNTANNYHRGLQWVEGNQVMVDQDGVYKVYELTVGKGE